MRTRPSIRGLAAALLALSVTAVGLVGTTVAPASAAGSNTLSIIAGTGVNDVPVPGPATSSPFIVPSQNALDSQGNLYVADRVACQVLKITPAGDLSVFAGTTCGDGPTSGPATTITLNSPSGLAIDSNDNVFIGSSGGGILKVTQSGEWSAFAPVSGRHLAIDSADTIYTADDSLGFIWKITSDGTITAIAGSGGYGVPTAGPATDSDLVSPIGIAVDSVGNVYFTDIDYDVNRVYKVTPGGELSVFAGTGNHGAVTEGPALDSDLDSPWGLSFDAADNLYIALYYNNQIVKVTPSGDLTIVAGTGNGGRPTPGPATDSDMDQPSAVTVSPSGALYITDKGNRMILKVGAAGGAATVPAAPIAIAVETGDTQVWLRFATPADGGSAITRYEAQIGTTAWTPRSCYESYGLTTCIIIGLTNYTSPSISVRAVNAIGAGDGSARFTVRPRLTGPVLTKVSANSSTSVHVAFNGVTVPGSTAYGYTAYAYLAGTDTLAGTCVAKPRERACDIKGLNPATSYTVRVVHYFRFNASRDVPRETLPSSSWGVRTKR